jgi:hypothetical protein
MGPLAPKVPKPKSPAVTPTLADASLFDQRRGREGFTTLVNTGPMGLTAPANTAKRSILGGSLGAA